MAKYSEIYKIDGKPIFEPKSCKVLNDSLADENSGRTADGRMHIDYILKDIRKVEFTFPALTGEEAGELLRRVQGKTYELTYLDPKEGVYTIECYTSNTTSALKHGVLYGGLWIDVGFSAIEIGGERP